MRELSVQEHESAFKLGLIINAYAGIGGALALKGSDGEAIRTQALAGGAQQLAPLKTKAALEELRAHKGQIVIYTGGADLGEDLAREMGFDVRVVYEAAQQQTEAADTSALAKKLLQEGVDIILFAGGDGTARNICSQVQQHCPVVGIPAGCKIHSGVYAITPASAGKVLAQVVKKELVSLMESEVKDIDESAFREGRVIAKHYGYMNVPNELQYMQAVKMGGKESDELVLADIGAHIMELMDDEPDTLFVMGSGSTVDSVMQELQLPNTLLGVDLVKNKTLVAQDLTAEQLLLHSEGQNTKLVITLIGGQGHILGRGNQQLSPAFIRRIGKENIIVVASKTKLQNLQKRPLISDSGDSQLDKALSGPIAVVTGYRDVVLYTVER